MATYIIGAILLGIVLLAARYVIRCQKQGGCVGCGGEDGRGGGWHCPEQRADQVPPYHPPATPLWVSP